MYAVSTALCEMAAEQGIEASEPGIHLFEELFLKSVEKNGRVREINTVAAFNLRMRRPFADAAIGVKMMQKGVISPISMLRKGQRDRQVSRIFEKIRQKQKQKA